MSYNGWANYETWAVNLWLSNDQGSYDYWWEQAQNEYREFHDQDPKTAEEETAGALAVMLKGQLEDEMPDLGASLWSDLLSAAMSEVEWLEIAEHMAKDAKDSFKRNNTPATPEKAQPHA